MSITSPESETRKEKGPVLPSKWDYETFKQFLLSQVRGKEFLMPLAEFPEEIELSEDWHNVLNILRDKTNKDQIERVAILGYNLNNRALYLPTEDVVEVPWSWEKNAPVAQTAVNFQRSLAITRGIDASAMGFLHSHPPDIHMLGLPIHISTGRLSAGDLYHPLAGLATVAGVADGPINSLAFRTKESVVPRESATAFYDLWEGDPQHRNLDVLIAQKYKLALFKGNINGSLKRTSPKK